MEKVKVNLYQEKISLNIFKHGLFLDRFGGRNNVRQIEVFAIQEFMDVLLVFINVNDNLLCNYFF